MGFVGNYAPCGLSPQTDGMPVILKKAGTYAAIYLRGNYYKSEEAFRKLLAYLDKHRLAPGEFVYKEAVLDELSAKEEEYLTRISVNCK